MEEEGVEAVYVGVGESVEASESVLSVGERTLAYALMWQNIDIDELTSRRDCKNRERSEASRRYHHIRHTKSSNPCIPVSFEFDSRIGTSTSKPFKYTSSR